MAQPTPYTREFNFSNQQAATPADPVPATHLDAELNRVKLTTDQILANLALIQADDGTIEGSGIADGSVGYDQLDPEIVGDLIAAGATPEAFAAALETALPTSDVFVGALALKVSTTALTGAALATAGVDSYLALKSGNFIRVPKDVKNIKGYGAVGDGAANDTTAVAAAKTAGGYVFVPEGDYLTTLTTAQLPKRMHGFGQVEDTTGKRAPNFIYQTAAPTGYGDHSFIGTAFDGDLSNVHIVLEKWIMGAGSLGAPVSPAYEQNPENASIYMHTYNASGANADTGSNGGRTGGSQIHLKFTHNGQGDFGGIYVNGTVTSSKVGATSFLASPAAVIINGGLIALSDHAFLNITELNAYDNGYDVAAMTLVSNYHRTNGTAALGESWIFCRAQSKGSEAADVAYMATGKWKVLLDATVADLGADKTVLAMKANDRIYGNAVASGLVAWCQSVGTSYFEFDATAGWRFLHDNQVSMSLGKVYATVNAPSGLLIGSTGCLNLLGANQAMTGSTTPTFAATNKPGATVAGPATWMKVVMAGTTYWAPLWAN